MSELTGRRVKQEQAGRRCKAEGCSTLLSVYNEDEYCALHSRCDSEMCVGGCGTVLAEKGSRYCSRCKANMSENPAHDAGFVDRLERLFLGRPDEWLDPCAELGVSGHYRDYVSKRAARNLRRRKGMPLEATSTGLWRYNKSRLSRDGESVA